MTGFTVYTADNAEAAKRKFKTAETPCGLSPAIALPKPIPPRVSGLWTKGPSHWRGQRSSTWCTLKDNATQAKVPAGRLGTRDAVASLEDITAKGPLTLKNVIVLGNPFLFTKDNIDQFDF